jgi:beta-phosphoglucomutase-like phosphatase (HAD superfamily)
LQSLEALRTHIQARSPSTAGTVLEARDCLVVEDSLAGIVSAKGAGMQAIGITHTYNAPQLRQSGADAIIHGLETLTPAWIDHRFARDPRATW